MTRTVGTRDRDEFVMDPEQAWLAGRRLDRLGVAFVDRHPRGVWRGTHEFFNAMDDAHFTAQARRLAAAPRARPEASYRDKDRIGREALLRLKSRLG